jgi:hypothetical protein
MIALRTTCLWTLALALTAVVTACPQREQKPAVEPPPEKRADLGEKVASPPALSPVAFLDESFAAVSRELFFSADGNMVKEAAYFGGSGRALFLSVPFDLERTDERAGPLYLVNTTDVTQTFQLKDAELVLNFAAAKSGGYIYHKLLEQVSPSAEEEEQKSLVPHEPSVGYTLQARLLKTDGSDAPLLEENMMVGDSFADGRLLAGRIVGVTPFLGHYGVGEPRAWTLYSPEGEAQLEFDYKPLLSPDCTIALDVVRHYDTGNYEESVFAIYSGEPGKSVADLSLLFSSPYFITLEEERWNPIAAFIGPSTMLVSRFVPVQSEGSVVPNTSGRLTLEKLDVGTRVTSVLMQLASPHISILMPPDSPVVFWLSRKPGTGERSFTLGVTAIDGSKQRVLAESLSAQRVELAGVDFASGRLLVVEHYSTGSGYSVMKEFVLSDAAPAPANVEEPDGSTGESPASGQDLPEPATGPPPITVPLKGT